MEKLSDMWRTTTYQKPTKSYTWYINFLHHFLKTQHPHYFSLIFSWCDWRPPRAWLFFMESIFEIIWYPQIPSLKGKAEANQPNSIITVSLFVFRKICRHIQIGPLHPTSPLHLALSPMPPIPPKEGGVCRPCFGVDWEGVGWVDGDICVYTRLRDFLENQQRNSEYSREFLCGHHTDHWKTTGQIFGNVKQLTSWTNKAHKH